MLASLRFFRYFILGLFLIWSIIIAIVAAWNLNLLQDARFPASTLSVRTDAYLIFVGCAGLALIFPILFCEVGCKKVFAVKVWFECAWVGLFCVMTLAGAASASVAAVDELCTPFSFGAFINKRGMCTSMKVVQGFTWSSGLLLFIYWTMLFGSSMLQRTEDSTIWQCETRSFPWITSDKFQLSDDIPKHRELSNRTSIGAALRRLSRAPSIVAPRPRNAANAISQRANILDFSRGLSGDFSNFTFPAVPAMGQRDRPVPPAPLMLAPELPSMATRAATQVVFGHSLYPQYVQEVITDPSKQSTIAPASQPLPRRQQASSPPPIGDWPRMDPTPRRKRSKPSADVLQLHIPTSRDFTSPSSSQSQQPASAPVRRPSQRRKPPTFDEGEFPSSAAPALQTPPNAFSSRARPAEGRQHSLDGQQMSRFSTSSR